MASRIIWRLSHDDKASEYFSSARKAYNAMIEEGKYDEFGDIMEGDIPTFKEAKVIARYNGYGIEKEWVR